MFFRNVLLICLMGLSACTSPAGNPVKDSRPIGKGPPDRTNPLAHAGDLIFFPIFNPQLGG
jgi:hypothetical protein